jgi:hypothetical protein
MATDEEDKNNFTYGPRFSDWDENAGIVLSPGDPGYSTPEEIASGKKAWLARRLRILAEEAAWQAEQDEKNEKKPPA